MKRLTYEIMKCVECLKRKVKAIGYFLDYEKMF